MRHMALKAVGSCDDLEKQDGGGRREAQEGRDILILIADSHCRILEHNIVKKLIKNKYIKKNT